MHHLGFRIWTFGTAVAAALAGTACSEPTPGPVQAVKPAGASAPTVPETAAENTPSGAAAELAVSKPGPFTLGREQLTVTLPFVEERRGRVGAFLAGSQPGSLRLAIEGIEILHPGGVYEVYFEAPEGSQLRSSDPSFLGHVALYGKAGQGPASTRTFDVTERARALWGKSRGPAGPLRVTFVPADESAEAGAPEASLRFRRVILAERPPAGR